MKPGDYDEIRKAAAALPDLPDGVGSGEQHSTHAWFLLTERGTPIPATAATTKRICEAKARQFLADYEDRLDEALGRGCRVERCEIVVPAKR